MRARDTATLWLPGVDWSGAVLAPEPADIEERRRALDAGTSFIVQAPAGSGKTELLIQRFLVLLSRVEQPEAIAAITFTVKAAGEMRARVLDALRNAQREHTPASHHERFTQDLAREALSNDARRGWRLLSNPDRLRIQTIDALCMKITRQMPWLSRFGAMPGVTEEARDMYVEAAKRAVEMLERRDEFGDAVACLLQHLENDAARTVDLLAGMLETRDHWLRVMGAHPDPAAVRDTLEASLQRIVADHLARTAASAPTVLMTEAPELLRYAASNVSDEDLARCSDISAPPDCFEHWLGVRRLLLTNDGEWRKRVDRSIGFPPFNKRMKQRLEALLASLGSAEPFRELLAQVPQLPAARYEESQWETLSALFRLLPMTVAHLRSVFTQMGKVDFIEIADAARRALGDADAPTDLALAMGARIDHLLVDEFQDTSVTQFDLLRALTAGWDEGQDRTLFLVGDPMQSIYRFRQAEVALYLNVRESGIGALQPEPLSLSVNFRSGRVLVDWINGLFAGMFPETADAFSGAVPYTPSVAFREGSAETGVSIHPFLGRNDQAEANVVVDLVQQTLRESPDARTAILVRSRTHLATIADSLRSNNVPYRAIEIQALAEKPVIQDLLALTRALLHLADRVAWLAVLRAPWCGLTLEDLHRIAATDRDKAVWDLLRAAALTEDGAARVSRIMPALVRAVSMRGRVPVAQLIERTWIALEGDRIADQNDLADARAYFDLLEEVDSGGDIPDLVELSRRVTDLFANPDAAASDAVELMTIHKAKGLEFDTVILPGLGKRPRVDDSILLLWSERPGPDSTDLLMAPISARRNGNDRTYEFIRRENDAKTRNESQRLLYVACTRAKHRLHLIGHVDLAKDTFEPTLGEPPRDSLLAHMWPAVRPQFEQLLAAMNSPTGETTATTRKPRPLNRIRMGFAVAEAEVEIVTEAAAPPRAVSDEQDVSRMVGTVTHRVLERIARDGVDKWPVERLTALRDALLIELDGNDAAYQRVHAALQGALVDPIGSWVLGTHPDARSEFAVSGVLDGEVRHLVIDRTFLTDEGVRWIIDFKTSEPADGDVEQFLDSEKREYQAQLRRYAQLLSELQGASVRVGLYFPLIGRWIEWNPFTRLSPRSI